jgi:EAL domain-containing protein (putative c-di-GMP-specific phosphodiesterase class I)
MAAAPAYQVTVPDIRRALDAEELVPFFQPKVNLTTGEVNNAEALVRWRHPEHGLIPPGAFIPLVEASKGLMDELTAYMIRHSVAQVKAWMQAGVRITVGVNVSVVNMMDLRMADAILALVQEQGVDPEQITIELTESAVTENVARLIEGLARLRMRRFGISIDDFGTGYSSLQQLSRLPFTELKIDTSFVQGATRNPRSRAVLESAVDLARRLGMHTVAEGVEEREDWDLLIELGVDYAQGYFVARPLPADEFLEWRQTWRPPA